KACIEVSKHNLIHILGSDSGVGNRVAGNPYDKAFNGFIVKFTEGGMGPPDNTGGHRCLLCRTLVAFLGDDLRVTILCKRSSQALPTIQSLDSLAPTRMAPARFLGLRTLEARMMIAFLSRRSRVAVLGFAGLLSLACADSARAEAQLLIEASTGKVLHAENATYPWYPASVTKLMTAYTTLRAIKEGRITLNTLLTVSRNAAAQQPTKMGFKVGTTVTVDNALKMLMVKSANDIAVTIAEGIGGSLESFADLMNANARRLGMSQSNFVNPNGLPAENHVTSARDLAILARALIREFPEYDSYWHISSIRYGSREMRNYNSLIYRYPGADGMKTGFICASGYNVVASATRNGRRLIAVVLGSWSGAVRAQKAAQLLERGFNSGGLSWLTPSLGTVDALAPMDAQ